MQKKFGVLNLVVVLTFILMSCSEASLAVDTAKTSITATDSSRTELNNCEAESSKACCAKKDVKKHYKIDSTITCSTDSVTCAETKEKCQNEYVTDSTINYLNSSNKCNF